MSWRDNRSMASDVIHSTSLLPWRIRCIAVKFVPLRLMCLKKNLVSKIINHWFMRQRAFIEIWSTREVWRARKMRNSCSRRNWEHLWPLDCSSNFPSASYLDDRTADAWTNCFITFSRHLFADVINVRNGNMKHARATEFDYTNLLAML